MMYNASTEVSAITRLRGRAGKSVTCRLHEGPVDNHGERNQSAQLPPLEERNQGVTPLQETHSVDTKSQRTQVEAGLARTREDPTSAAVERILQTAPPLSAHQRSELKRLLG